MHLPYDQAISLYIFFHKTWKHTYLKDLYTNIHRLDSWLSFIDGIYLKIEQRKYQAKYAVTIFV